MRIRIIKSGSKYRKNSIQNVGFIEAGKLMAQGYAIMDKSMTARDYKSK